MYVCGSAIDKNDTDVKFSRVASKSLKKASEPYRSLIVDKIRELAQDPYNSPNVKALKGAQGGYRLRVADYRVIYTIEDNELVILVVEIDHRSKVYKKR